MKKIEEDFKRLRKVRIFYNDPDATDSDDDEESGPADMERPVKRVMYEVQMPLPSGSNTDNKLEPSARSSPARSEKPVKACVRSKHKGVRLRKWGKWAAEIRHPIHHYRKWIGTFNTEEEAVAAYRKTAEEYKKLVKMGHTSDTTSAEGEDEVAETSYSVPSPSSVLDVSTTNSFTLNPCSNTTTTATSTSTSTPLNPAKQQSSCSTDNAGSDTTTSLDKELPTLDFASDFAELDPNILDDLEGLEDFGGLDDLPIWDDDFSKLDIDAELSFFDP